mmetsp:Transcript_13579/g.28367  ORF Transcript_13579/g.28367 Transcript_13579/m.28367 type:complete len:157 (+) Transcript_13579:51-521(+)
MEVHINWRWFFASWKGPLVDEVVGAVGRPMWPEVASPDWSWEDGGIDFQPPPYHVDEEGMPWRFGLDAGLLGTGLQKTSVSNIGKGLGGHVAQSCVAAEESLRGLGKGQGRGSHLFAMADLEDEVLDVHLPGPMHCLVFSSSGFQQCKNDSFEAAD